MSEIAVVEAVAVQATVQEAVTASHGLACNRLDDLRMLYRRHINWHIAVQSHLYHGGPVPNVRQMPSKAAKHRMYEAANWFRYHYGIKLDRPNNLAEVGAIMVAAEIRLAGLDKDKNVLDGEPDA